jgi:hypothetical protein
VSKILFSEKNKFYLRTITVTSFALSAQIFIQEAKQYIHQKTKQINANFEAIGENKIIMNYPDK